MIRRLISVSGFTALSRLTGFGRDVMMAAILGAGPVSDAFMVAFRLPNHFRAVFAEGAFNAAFLPRYAASATKERGVAADSGAARFANEVFAWQLVAQLVLLVAALFGMRWVIMVLAPGFTDNPAQMALAIELTRITFPYLLCMAIVVQLSAMLNTILKFNAAAAAPIFLGVSMMIALAFWREFPTPAHAAAFGVLAAGILEASFLVWAAARSGLHLRFTIPRWTPQMKEFLRALGAATIGAGSVQIGLFVDTIIASFLAAGDLTALYYADRINQLPMGIIGVALGTILLPDMSARIAANDIGGANVAQNRAVALGLLLTLPCVAAFFTIPETIMRALFAHGAFGVQSADRAAQALMAYAVGLPAFVLMRCVTPSFYARGDTATPVRATLVSVAVNIALKIALVWGLMLGIVGLALGTSVAAWVNLVLLLYLANRRSHLALTADLKRALGPVVAAALAAAAGFLAGERLGFWFMPEGTVLREELVFLSAATCGAVAFALVVLVLRTRLPLRSA
ncbi:MAG: murein biosynthesis integral membrane protein MurJ [Alphaproteobacteria bacterium]